MVGGLCECFMAVVLLCCYCKWKGEEEDDNV